MIYTLTMNPALDKTIIVHSLKLDAVNRVSSSRIDPGGKGINVSNMVKQLGGSSEAIIAIGGATGNQLLGLLDKKEIPYKTFDVTGDTRINTKAVDPDKKTFTDINEPGPLVANEILEHIKAYLTETLKVGDILVLAGSLPRGVDAKFYQELVKIGNQRQAKVIVDADGDNLKYSILEKPFMIKPNEHELEMYFNRELDSQEKLVDAARVLVKEGIACVVISLGEKGCLAVTAKSAARSDALKLEVKSTVGAGDSMVAGIAYYLDQKKMGQKFELSIEELMEAVKLGAASSSASIEQEGTVMGSRTRVDELVKLINYTVI